MDKKVYNEFNLKDSEINEIVTRVKIYLINSNNEIMVASSNGGIQLPGGHVENDETPEIACIREIQEETGIVVNQNEIPKPFFEICHYTPNYKGTNKNRISKIIYYVLKTDQKYNPTCVNLTENEKHNNFQIISIPYNKFEERLKFVNCNNEQEINRVIAKEILESFNYLKKYIEAN